MTRLFQLLLVLLICPLFQAAFVPSDLRGLYVFRFGRAKCPQTLEFPSGVDQSTLSGSSILLNESECSGGELSIAETPGAGEADTPGKRLARYLSGTREAGEYLVATVTETLECPGRRFLEDVAFTFIGADRDFAVSWQRVFENNDTWLATNSPQGDSFRFESRQKVMIVDSECLYNRIDVPEKRTRACFPGMSKVYLADGRSVPMRELGVGNRVKTLMGVSDVLGWSHHTEEYMYVIRLHTPFGTLMASEGHFVSVDGQLRQMSDARVGMTLKHVQGEVRITHISRGVEWGMYNPHTSAGELIVDGFVVSCYTSAVKPVLAHALLAPVRGFAILWHGVRSI